MVKYAAKVGEPVRVPVPSRVGAKQEAYCSALGKTLLAGLPAQEFDDFLYDGEFVALTSAHDNHDRQPQIGDIGGPPARLCRRQPGSDTEYLLRRRADLRSGRPHGRRHVVRRCR